MKNITKMRIIRGRMNKAEAEYLLEFFKYIGLITYDDAVDEFYPNSWNNRLEIVNDSDGVDVVLNCFDKNDYSYSSKHPNRIYLYFSFENRYCIVSDVPLSKVEVLSQSITEDKRELRSNALNILINKIWEGDEENRKAIQYILNCYVSVSEDRDLFYILQAKRCCDILRSREAIREVKQELQKSLSEKKKKNKDAVYSKITIQEIEEQLPRLYINEYVKKIFTELWSMQCLLKGNNPYVVFTRTNTSILIYELSKLATLRQTDELFNEIEFEGKKFDITITYPYKLISELQSLLEEKLKEENRYFNLIISLLFVKLHNLDDDYNSINKKMQYLNYLIKSSQNSNLPAYYSNVFFLKAMCYSAAYYETEQDRYKEATVENLKQALKCNPQNYQANYELGLIYTKDGNFKSAESFLNKIPYESFNYYFYSEDPQFFSQISLEEIFIKYEVMILRAIIYLNRNMENGMKATINEADVMVLAFEKNYLMEIISEPSESLFHEFMKHQEYSYYLFYLYHWLEPWVEDVIHDNYLKKRVREKLSKWGQ